MSNQILKSLSTLRYQLQNLEMFVPELLSDKSNGNNIGLLISIAEPEVVNRIVRSKVSEDDFNRIHEYVSSLADRLIKNPCMDGCKPLYRQSIKSECSNKLPKGIQELVFNNIDHAYDLKKTINSELKKNIISTFFLVSNDLGQCPESVGSKKTEDCIKSRVNQSLNVGILKTLHLSTVGHKKFAKYCKGDLGWYHQMTKNSIINSAAQSFYKDENRIFLDASVMEAYSNCKPIFVGNRKGTAYQPSEVCLLLHNFVNQIEYAITERNDYGKVILSHLSRRLEASGRSLIVGASNFYDSLSALIDLSSNLNSMSIRFRCEYEALLWKNEKLRVNQALCQTFDVFKTNCLALMQLESSSQYENKSFEFNEVINTDVGMAKVEIVETLERRPPDPWQSQKTIDVNVVVTEECNTDLKIDEYREVEVEIDETVTIDDYSGFSDKDSEHTLDDSCFYLPEELLASSGLSGSPQSNAAMKYMSKETGLLSLDAMFDDRK